MRNDGNNPQAELRQPGDLVSGKRFPLTEKQQEFFRMGQMQTQRIQDQMNGALQCICMENGLQGNKVSVSQDGTELVIEQ